jgi:hypothetical protein
MLNKKYLSLLQFSFSQRGKPDMSPGMFSLFFSLFFKGVWNKINNRRLGDGKMLALPKYSRAKRVPA